LSPVDSVNAVLDLIDGPGNDSADATLSYTHQRFESSVRHNVVRTLDDDGKWRLENRTAGSFSSAFVFADGHVAISRPISNSFAMIVPHPRLKGRTVGVDPLNGHYLSESDWLGPPVVPNISAYFSRPLLLAVPDAPATYDIGNDRPTVQPGY
jgi:outer membrane usher protein